MAVPQLLWRLLDGTTPTDCDVCETGEEWLLGVTYRGKTVFRGRYPSQLDAEEHAAVLWRNLIVNGWTQMPAGVPDAAPRPTPRVLLIVVDSASREQCRQDLEQIGFSVETASNAAGGLRAVQRRVPDVVVVDLALPDLGASEVLRRLRGDYRTAGVPVAALSRGDEALLSPGHGFDHVLRDLQTDSVTNTVTSLIPGRASHQHAPSP